MMPGDEQITIQVDDAEVEATAAKIEEALGKKEEVDAIKDSADQATQSADDLAAQEPGIRGTNLLVRRTVTQIPGLREGYHYAMLIRMMIVNNPFIASILVAWMAGRAFLNWLNEGNAAAKEAAEYRQQIMTAQGFTTRAQFDVWLANDKKNTSEAYKGDVPRT